MQLLPNPDEEFQCYKKKDTIINLNPDYISKLIDDCKRQLIQGNPVIKLSSPIKIFGSINGQYNDLMRYFCLFGRPSELKGDIECVDYLFLGNFSGRGAFSLETLCLLLAMRTKFNGRFHLLRGNQEDKEIAKICGLEEECREKLKEDTTQPNSIFNKLCDLFEYLPLVAIINNQIACIHSGVGNNSLDLNEVKKLIFPISVKDCPAAKEILWNIPTPNNNENESINSITKKYRNQTYNTNLVVEFLKKNKLKMIIRSHDICDMGLSKCFGDRVMTIFSSTNYCGIYKNSGATLFIKKSYDIQTKKLTCEDNIAVWQKSDWSKTEYPPSPKRNYAK